MKIPAYSLCAAMAVMLAPPLKAASTAYSGAFTVDTRGTGNLTVTGRVLDKAVGLGLGGANVNLAGRDVTTGGIRGQSKISDKNVFSLLASGF